VARICVAITSINFLFLFASGALPFLFFSRLPLLFFFFTGSDAREKHKNTKRTKTQKGGKRRKIKRKGKRKKRKEKKN
jgi:hypothetical protein